MASHELPNEDSDFLEMIATEQLVRFSMSSLVSEYEKIDLEQILQALFSNTLGYDENVRDILASNVHLSSDLNYIVYGLAH